MKAGWNTKRLGDLVSFAKSQHRDDKPLPYVGMEDISSGTGAFLGSLEPRKVMGGSFCFNDKHVLYGRLRPYLNKVLSPNFEGHCSTEIFPLLPCDALDKRFLFYWLTHPSTVALISSTCTGARMPRANMNEVLEFNLLLPPLSEQQRLVTILDEAFDGIATVEANAEKNLVNAREVFETAVEAVFSRKGTGWLERQLGDIATFRNGINFTKTSSGEAVKIVGVKDFQQHFHAPLDSLETVIPDGDLPEQDCLQPGDILFVRSNGNKDLIGRSLLIGPLQEKTTFSGFTIRGRLNNDTLLPDYLCHFLKSGKARQAMIAGGNGVNIKSLNQTTLASLPISFPATRVEQNAVVVKLTELGAETQRLEAIYLQKMAALNELKQSILHQAFTGQLN